MTLVASGVKPAAAADCGPSLLETVQKRGKVVIGVATDAVPFGYIDKDGNRAGFAVDLAKEIADTLKVKLELRDTNPTTRIPLVQSGAVDLVIEPSLITKQRWEVVDFTVPYFMDLKGNRMVVQKGSAIKGYADLGGKTVAVTQGSIAIQRLKRNAPDAKLLVLQDYPQTFMAVKRGQADALFAMDYVVADMLEKNKDDSVEATPPLMEFQLLGMMLRQNDSKWRNAINFVLHDLWQSKKYHEIYRKHFKSDPHPNFSIPQWEF
jgi:polar amino acid transport system substrate-binding protein